jgi:hypothetical protein
MDIVAALFIEGIDLNSAFPGGPTRIDLTGVHFSATPPSPPPVTVAPHMVVLVRCADDEDGSGVLEVVFRRRKPGADPSDAGGAEQLARNVQPLQVEPGKFTYRLVRAELELDDYGTVEAHCRVGQGPVTVVPYTLVPGPAAEAAPPIEPAGQ